MQQPSPSPSPAYRPFSHQALVNINYNKKIIKKIRDNELSHCCPCINSLCSFWQSSSKLLNMSKTLSTQTFALFETSALCQDFNFSFRKWFSDQERNISIIGGVLHFCDSFSPWSHLNVINAAVCCFYQLWHSDVSSTQTALIVTEVRGQRCTHLQML